MLLNQELRYLRAVKWASAEKAIQRIERTLKWRREYGLYDLVTPAYVEPEVCVSSHICRSVLISEAFRQLPARQSCSGLTQIVAPPFI
jgi:hypothetical protein